ncbi:MAG: FecR domain-containing protein [Deltaproteobacteria bacterium]|nr:FecR domain-containing protein [Deltaproteobacteria bacterium]
MRKSLVIFLSLFLFFSILSGEEIRYTDHSLARLSFLTGNAYIQKAGDLAYEQGLVNMPIAEGDRINTTEGKAEIYIGNSNYIRLDAHTKIDFTALPSVENDLIQIKLWTGNIIISLESLYEGDNIELHTPDISVYLLDQGLYRVNVNDSRNTELFVYEGVAEAAGESESILLKDGQKLEAARGYYTGDPLEFMSASGDSFYEWSAERDSLLRQHFAKRYLSEKLDDFEYELNTYGNWNYVSPYGYVWVPAGISPHWRPYYNGRWLWYPICGWTWLPYEPWGWVTFHYGRWHWSIHLGWYWIPHSTWGPAWVRWYYWNDYWAWAPLSYYGYAGVIINNIYYPNYNSDSCPGNSGALTVVHKDNLRAKNLSKAALTQVSLKKLGGVRLYRSVPSVKDFPKPVSIEKLDGKKVLLQYSTDKININGSRTLKNQTENAQTIRNLRDQGKTRIVNRELGYPSSLGKLTRKYISGKDSKSIVGKAIRYFSSGKSQYMKSRSNPYKGKSTSKVTSTAAKRTSSSASKQNKSSSQTKRSSGSRTVKKKER